MSSEEAVGSLAEEAGKLFATAQTWLARVADNRDPAKARSHTDAEPGTECRYCPVCQALSALDEWQPELAQQLRDLGEGVVGAIRATVLEHEREWTARPDTTEHIDIDDA
jgi:hypothetical protein